MSTIDACIERSNRTNLYSLRPDVVWCFMLDSSHPEVQARYGRCEDYYAPSHTYPGIHWFCQSVMTATGAKCKAECVLGALNPCHPCPNCCPTHIHAVRARHCSCRVLSLAHLTLVSRRFSRLWPQQEAAVEVVWRRSARIAAPLAATAAVPEAVAAVATATSIIASHCSAAASAALAAALAAATIAIPCAAD